MNLKFDEVEPFEHYSQFSTIEEFHHHVEMWLSEYKQEFPKGQLVGFNRLVCFATELPVASGVCQETIGNILKVIQAENNGNGISRSTFKRMRGKAKSLGI